MKGRHPVLVVDDQPEIRNGLAQYLRDTGYDVETASNGRDAMRKLREGLRPCIILMDLMMPEMNGFMFRTEQLQDPELSQIPLIAHSGVHDLPHYANILGADAYIEKPAALEYIMSVVQKHCLKHPDVQVH